MRRDIAEEKKYRDITADIFSDFPSWLRREQVKHHMTQAQLAEKIGVSSVTLSSWVNGRGAPSMDSFMDTLLALGCRIVEP